MLLLILGLIVAYLIGSFSSSVWIGKWFYKTDVRQYGSGNAGTTNTIRILGWKPGVVVLLLDVFKGWLPIQLDFLFLSSIYSSYEVYYDVALSVAVLLGHVFPIYTGFRGGKGVATLVGIILALYPMAFCCAFCLFFLIFILTRYVSLSSIVSAISFPFISIFIFNEREPILVLFSILIGVFIPITHRKNIQRLIKGEESKLDLFGKNKKDQNKS
ncbi:MAG: glycerol-3-phosphate 1-O-acyltransferase PlsY [Bacteroidales bacterium]